MDAAPISRPAVQRQAAPSGRVCAITIPQPGPIWAVDCLFSSVDSQRHCGLRGAVDLRRFRFRPSPLTRLLGGPGIPVSQSRVPATEPQEFSGAPWIFPCGPRGGGRALSIQAAPRKAHTNAGSPGAQHRAATKRYPAAAAMLLAWERSNGAGARCNCVHENVICPRRGALPVLRESRAVIHCTEHSRVLLISDSWTMPGTKGGGGGGGAGISPSLAIPSSDWTRRQHEGSVRSIGRIIRRLGRNAARGRKDAYNRSAGTRPTLFRAAPCMYLT